MIVAPIIAEQGAAKQLEQLEVAEPMEMAEPPASEQQASKASAKAATGASSPKEIEISDDLRVLAALLEVAASKGAHSAPELMAAIQQKTQRLAAALVPERAAVANAGGAPGAARPRGHCLRRTSQRPREGGCRPEGRVQDAPGDAHPASAGHHAVVHVVQTGKGMRTQRAPVAMQLMSQLMSHFMSHL
eukprot:8442655-Pyramimonas_sp.AAC.1